MDFMGIHWAGADNIIALPIFLFFGVLIVRNYLRIKKAWPQLTSRRNQSIIFKHFSLARQRIKAFLLCTSLLLVFLAILQPQWGKKEQTVLQEGRDVMVLLDISRSMNATDTIPSRLEAAKLKIRDLVSKLTSERVGLIVFSGSAFIQCPLTADHAAFLMFLDNVDTEITSSGTTSFDKALAKAVEAYASSTRKTKLVVLVTDGEDFSTNLNTATAQAVRQNLHVFALGIGSTQGAPIPKLDAHGHQIGHETDEQGNIALSKLDEARLKELCSSLHGHYIKSTNNDSDIDTLVRYVHGYEKEQFTDKKMSLFHDQYPWFLGLAWICLALEWVL